MTDPILNLPQLPEILPLDDTSDVSGGAAVTPSYIPAAVTEILPTEELLGVDNVSVSTPAVSTAQINMSGLTPGVEPEETSNYIQSTVEEPTAVAELLDSLGMNTLEEIQASNTYIDANDSSVTDLIAELKQNWIIYDGMTEDQLVDALKNYVSANFTYVTEATGDVWQTVAQTIQDKTGDCEDFANVFASLLVAALIDKGVNPEDAKSRVSCVVVLDGDMKTGHIFVQFTGVDGDITYINPSTGATSDTIGDFQVVFTYTADTVDLRQTDFDYSKFITASYSVPLSGPDFINSILGLVVSYEDQAWALSQALRKSTMASGVKAAQAAMNAAQSAFNYYSSVWSGSFNADQRSHGTAYYNYVPPITSTATWQSVCAASIAQMINILVYMGYSRSWATTFCNNPANWGWDSGTTCAQAISAAATLSAYYSTYNTWQTSITTYNNTVNEYVNMFGVNDVDSIISQYMTLNAGGYYELTLATMNALPVQMSNLKGMLMVVSLLYETRRDLRNLVEQELTGEASTGYKGMPINKLMMKRVDKLEAYFQMQVANVLKAVQSLNASKMYDDLTALNNTYDSQITDIRNEDVGACENDTRERRALEKENEKTERVNTVNRAASYAASQNAAAAEAFLTSTGMLSEGGSIDDMIGSLTDAVNNTVANLDTIERKTTDANDYDGEYGAYKEVNWDQVSTLRGAINGAVAMRRMFFAAKMAMADMRNLVHQEMTGLGGRQSRMDIAQDMNEKEGQNALQWFDESVQFTTEKINLNNEVIKNKLQMDQNQEMIDELKEQEAKSTWSKIIGAVALALAVVLAVFTFGATLALVLVIVDIGLGMTSAGLAASAASEIADKRRDLEVKYSKYDMVATENTYDPTYNPEGTGDPTLDLALGSENASQTELYNMNSANYLSYLDDAGSTGATGTSVFDTIHFASAYQNIRNNNIKILIAEAARRAKNEMRNIAHQELTGVGGRNPSNMTTYAIEAARVQQAAAANYQYMNLMDLNQSRNMLNQRTKNIALFKEYAAAANTGFWLSLIPIAGGPAANLYTNLSQLYTQKDVLEDIINGKKFGTTYTLDDAELQALITEDGDGNAAGEVGSGDGNKAVDSTKLNAARQKLTEQFMQRSVENAMKKTLSEIRSLVHMEMTGIRSATSGNMAEQANMLAFQTAMQSIQLINSYLSQKVQIENAKNQASQQLATVNKQITTTIVMGVISIAAAIATGFIPGGFASFTAALSTLQLCSSVASTIMGISNAINSYINFSFARDRATDDMGAIMQRIKTRQIVNDNVNSNTDRLEDLEQQCIDELTEQLIESLGGGYAGVNKGMASRYKNFIERLYKAENTKADVQETLQELRSMVHETMTGTSSVTSNMSKSLLSMRQQNVTAAIDSMFEMLQSAADRMNQLTDAKKQEVKAQMQFWSSAISAAIQTAITTITLTNALSKEAFKLDKAQDNVKTAKDALKKATDSKGDVTAATKKLNDANSELLKASDAMNALSKSSTGTIMTLELTDVVSKIAMAYIEKSALENSSKESEARVASQGVSPGNGQSETMEANVMAGDLETMAAERDAESGRSRLQADAKLHKTENKTDNIVKQAWNDAAKEMMNKTASIIKEIKQMADTEKAVYIQKSDQEKLMQEIMTSQNMQVDTELQKTILDACQGQFMTKDAMTDLLKTAQQLTKAGNNPTAVQQVITQNKQTVDTFKPTEHQRANTKALSDRLDQIFSRTVQNGQPTETGTVTQLESEIKDIEQQLKKEDLQKVREELIQKLNLKKAQLKTAKEEVVRLKKELAAAQETLGKIEEAWEREKKELGGDIDEINKKIAALMNSRNKKQAEGQNVDLMDREIAKLERQMLEKMAQMEIARSGYEIGQGGIGAVTSDIKKADDDVKKLQGEVSEIQGAIKDVTKQIGQKGSGQDQEQGGKKKKKGTYIGPDPRG